MATPKRLLIVLLLLLTASTAALGQIVTTPSLQVCLPIGNDQRLSSNGCACNINADCTGVCGGPANVKTCRDGPDVPGCAVPGSGLGLSWNGCACDTDADCRNACSGGIPATRTCYGGSEPAGPPDICSRPGRGFGDGVDGCPCSSSADCVGTCNALTNTCGGIIGAVANVQPVVTGLAEQRIALGATTIDRALGETDSPMPSSMAFRAYGPDDEDCTQVRFQSHAPVAATGVADSEPFRPEEAGLWRWRAVYQGNAWNLPAATACDDALQQVLVVSERVFGDGFE